MMQKFTEKLTAAIEQNDSLLCVGLDPDPYKFPDHFNNIETQAEEALSQWGAEIVDQTQDLVCCYKPNFAFYEQFGPAGLSALQRTIQHIPTHIPVLLDAKRGDIGSTAIAYARAAFEIWGADAITLNPYLGQDSIAPFVAYADKTVFILCYTSNASASEIQEFTDSQGQRLFEHIVTQAQGWASPEQIAFVVGATQPHALASFRAIAPDHLILLPGVGAQGGNLTEALAAGLNKAGAGVILPVSRTIIYAAEPRVAAKALQQQINQARVTVTEQTA